MNINVTLHIATTVQL